MSRGGPEHNFLSNLRCKFKHTSGHLQKFDKNLILSSRALEVRTRDVMDLCTGKIR